jgi:hypothetical protein
LAVKASDIPSLTQLRVALVPLFSSIAGRPYPHAEDVEVPRVDVVLRLPVPVEKFALLQAVVKVLNAAAVLIKVSPCEMGSTPQEGRDAFHLSSA